MQIYYLESLPKAGRVSVSGTSPVGTAFSPPSAPPKCHCSNYRGNRKGKLARGNVNFVLAAPLPFLSHFFYGTTWELTDHRLKAVTDIVWSLPAS